MGNPKPFRILNWPFIAFGHPDGERGHIIHKKISEMFGSDNDEHIRSRLFESFSHAVERLVKMLFGNLVS
jgi:hypothetical protein